MKMNIKEIFDDERIEYFALLPYGECKETRKYLLDKKLENPVSVICFAVPYYTGKGKRLSSYAVSRDYHLYMHGLLNRICERLSTAYPDYNFFGFADHSPIDERDACAKSGIGMIGKNGLLITEKYSSYVFLAEIVCDAGTEIFGCFGVHGISYCEKCGMCMKKCPMNIEGCDCLSAISQKKGKLTEEERNLLIKYDTVWGCDICQEVCPHTKRAISEKSIYTPIDFFYQNRIELLTKEKIMSMSDDEFSSRAFSWRGRETIMRNIELFEKK